jgi:hypothetical protein
MRSIARHIARLIALMLAIGGITFVALAIASAPAQAKDMDCDNFNTQADAQHYFNDHGGGPNNNVDLLDSDGDGVACESNPCPCTTGGGGGGNNPPPAPQKKKHALTAEVVRAGPARKLTLNGKVTTFKGGQVQVLRKSAGGGFRLYKRTQASPTAGAFARPLAYVGTDKTCFQVVAPETKNYLKTVKFLGCFTKP